MLICMTILNNIYIYNWCYILKTLHIMLVLVKFFVGNYSFFFLFYTVPHVIPLTTSYVYKSTYTETQKKQVPKVSATLMTANTSHPEDSLLNLSECNPFITMFLMLYSE